MGWLGFTAYLPTAFADLADLGYCPQPEQEGEHTDSKSNSDTDPTGEEQTQEWRRDGDADHQWE